MKLRRYTRFQIAFESNWIQAASALMGMSFFLRIVYYFALMNLREVGIVELLTSMIFGVLLCIAFVVCLTCLRLNAPGLYGIFGTAQCFMMIVLSFTSGSPVRIVLAILWYCFVALVLLATVSGYLPGRLFAALLFALSVFVRLFFFDFGHLGLIRWVQELAVLCVLCGLGSLCMGLKAMYKSR